MPISINYKNNLNKKNSSNLILFVDEKFNISGLKKYISSSEYSFVSDLIKTKDLKKKIINIDVNSKRKIILVSIDKNLTNSDVENLGAKSYDLFKDIKQNEYCLNSDTATNKLKNIVGYFLHGLKLKSYSFDKYKTKKIIRIFL